MANQVWNRLGQITSDYKKSQQAPSLNNNQYSSYYSKLYPGLNEESYNKMVNAVDSLGLTGENRTNAMNNYYRTHVKTLINDQTLQERDDIINQQAYEAAKLNNKDANAELRMTEAVQRAKKLWNLDATADDREVFSTMVDTLGPDGTKLAGQYLSGENNEFLKATGLDDNKANQLDNDSYAKIEGKINGALKGDWGKLSTNGLKYVQGWKLILDATELAKAKGATGMNDGEIMRNVIKSSPKLQQKVAEIQAIQKELTDGDKSILNGKSSGITVGKSGFSLLPGVSIQLGDDTGMNISLVNDKPASYKEIQDLIDVREKFGDNYVGEVGNVAKVYANQPIDTLKKRGNQALNEFENTGLGMESIINDIMPKGVVELLQGRDMTDEEFEQYKQSRAAEYTAMKNKNKEQVLKYNDKINKAFQKQVEQNLDPQLKEYYDNKTITELLAMGDLKGVGYKQAQMVASNWDMLPNIVVTAVNTPAGMTLMFGDSYARESQDSFERLMEAGADYDQASGISKVVGVINGVVEVGLDRLLGGVETTASKNLKNAFMKNLTEEATKKGFWNILGGIAKRQIGSSLEEGAEEVIQEIVSNAAEMTIKDNPEFADLFKGTWEAFEGGVFNPMNLMAGGSDIAANKGDIQQSLLDASYDAGVTARNIVDAGENMKNNVREFMLDGAYKAGKGARNIVEWADKVKEFMSRKKNQNQTTNNVEVETTEKVEKQGLGDRITDWAAEKITNTVSAQDKLYKAQEPRMNTLTSKKNLEKRRSNSDRANQLIVENGYTPTNTTERVEAHQATLNKLWNKVKSQINGGKGVTVDQTPIIEALENYINEKKKLNIASIESDIVALEKELESLKQSQADGTADLPVLENKKQVYNDIANWKEHEASKVYNDGIQLISAEIGKIEDNLLSQIPGEFSNLKKDVGALLDAYDDVFKADMKNQRSKGNGLTEAYSRIEGVSDIVNGIVGAFTGKGSLESIAKGGAKILVGKSLAKAKNVDFLIEQGFKELAKQYGNNGNVTTNTTPTTPTATTPTTRTTTEITEDIDNETPQDVDYQDLAELENETLQDLDYQELAELENETAQMDYEDEVTTTPKKKTTKKKTSKKQNINNINQVDASKANQDMLFEDVDQGVESEGLNPEVISTKDLKKMDDLKNVTSALSREDKTDYISHRIAEDLGVDRLGTDDEMDRYADIAGDVENMIADYEYDGSGEIWAERLFPGERVADIIKEYTERYENDLKAYKALVGKYKGYEKGKVSLKGLDKNQTSSKTVEDINETPQIDWRFEEDLEEENLRDLENNETSQEDEAILEDLQVNMDLMENETPQIDPEEREYLETQAEEQEIQILPADVSVEKEATQVGEKRISPDRIAWHQLTFNEGVDKIYDSIQTIADYLNVRAKLYTSEGFRDGDLQRQHSELQTEASKALYGKDKLGFISDRSAEFKNLRKNITENKDNPAALKEIAKTFYISKVKKDISKGYQFPVAVLEKIPGAAKALNARERYQKGVDTSFSAKDARIDYSEKDKIGGGIKSQDGKQVTKEQKDNIVKGILDFQDVFGIDVKKIAEDKGIVFVDLHGGNAFLSQAAGLYREATNQEGGDRNVSVSVGGSETIRWKDNQTKEWKTEKVNTTMSHELGHAMDYLVDKKLLDRSDYLDLYQKYKKPQNRRSGFAKYLERPTEVTARAFEEYMDVAKGGDTYYDKLGYWNKEDFEYIVKPILEEAIEKKLGDWKLKK